ncbi:MAG: tRNA pseudouridine(55) synthase TruB [Lachnospirales bacterium]
MNGFVNINKEKDWTSNDVVGKVKSILRHNGIKEKVGHTGTLDPNATGVLPICIGTATKLSDAILNREKEYFCEIIFGIQTNTDDITGAVVRKMDVPPINLLKNAIENFVGIYDQVPPKYSAIKINGRKMYEYARKGENIEILPRKVNIMKISEIQNIDKNKFTFLVKCSKGTYIRALCRDIGEGIGTCATMGDLKRVETSGFNLENAISIKEFEKEIEDRNFTNILSVDRIFTYKKLSVKKEGNKYLYNGNKINKYFIVEKDINPEEKYFLYDESQVLVGIYTLNEEFFKPDYFLFKK